MAARQTFSLDQIKDMLLARVEAVAHHYAPAAKGSHTHFGKYFTLNPGRVDRSVGSFYVHLTGARAGYFMDHASGDHGDILDLIALACHTDTSGALREARAFLGLETLDPADRRRREDEAARLKVARRQAEQDERRQVEATRRRAHALWLAGQAQIRGTPAEHYLRNTRGIDLARLGRQPGALRYIAKARYYYEDDETGEVFDRTLPALLAIVTNRHGKAVACHRHFLALGRDGRWTLASKPEVADPVPKGKLVLGRYGGGWITVWNGIGPRGGKPGSLLRAPMGQHVYIAEGVEDALSAVMLLPEARILAALSLSNLGALDLPANVATVTLVADLDANEAAQAALSRAIEQHQKAGREVRLWQNRHGGKDLNDALLSAKEHQKKEGAA